MKALKGELKVKLAKFYLFIFYLFAGVCARMNRFFRVYFVFSLISTTFAAEIIKYHTNR